MKKKVLVVLSGLSAGGAETMYINLYRKMDKDYFSIDFLTFSKTNEFYTKEVKKCGSKILSMPSIKEVGVIRFCKIIEKKIRDNGPYNVVHSNIDYLSGLVLRAAKKCKVEIRIAHSHNTAALTHKGEIPKIAMAYLRWQSIRNSTHFLACSYEAAVFMFGKKIANKSIIINNAIDLARFCENAQYKEQKESREDRAEIRMLHIGRFVEQKNHIKLINIFNEFLQIHDDARLYLVGEGELRQKIEVTVHKLGLSDKVIFLGARADVPELMSNSDVFLLPSKFEGLPVTLVEAQAMNLPCVVSDTVKKDVDCGLGLISFVDVADTTGWILAIEKMINARQSRNNFEIMTEKGFNIDNNVGIIEKLYGKR